MATTWSISTLDRQLVDGDHTDAAKAAFTAAQSDTSGGE